MSYICGDCGQEHKVPKREEDEQEKVSTGSAGLACVLALVRERNEMVLQIEEMKRRPDTGHWSTTALALKAAQKDLEAANRLLGEAEATIKAEALRAKMLETVHRVALGQNDKFWDVMEMWDSHLPTIILNPEANYELVVPAPKVKAFREIIDTFTKAKQTEKRSDPAFKIGETEFRVGGAEYRMGQEPTDKR